MSATSRTIQTAPGMGQLVVIFAALLAGTALIVALAYGQLTASQASLAPAAAPAPAVHDHGWSSSSVLTTPSTYARGWGSTVLTTPATYARGWESTAPAIRTHDFDKAHAPAGGGQVVERGSGSNRLRFAE